MAINNNKKSKNKIDSILLERKVNEAKNDFDLLHRLLKDRNTSKAWDQLVKMNQQAEIFKNDTGLDTYHTALNKLSFTKTLIDAN